MTPSVRRGHIALMHVGRALLLAGAICLSVGLASSASALADAGTIASATPVVYGQQEFGNTTEGGVGQPGCDSSTGSSYRSWWALSVTAGDALTVDWETHSTSMNLNLFPVGTTDYTFLDTNLLTSEEVNANYKAEATYTATQTGIVPLEFHSDTGCGNPPGPYNFTASVLHAVVLSLPTVTSLPLNGTISVDVHNPDGVSLSDPGLSVTFNVLVSGESAYVGVGSAPVSNGVATINFAMPSTAAGHSVTIEATSNGAGYVPGSSATQVVSVPAPPTCVVPAVGHAEQLAVEESALATDHCAVGQLLYMTSSNVPRGDVVRLEVDPGTKLAAGSPVGIVVSNGPTCVVPSVARNETLRAVEHAVLRANCTVGRVRYVRSRHHRRGMVVGLSPASNRRLSPQSHVQITVSRGR